MLNDIWILWCDHKIIGTIIGILVIAFLIQLYLIPFEIVSYYSEKTKFIQRLDRSIRTYLSLIVLDLSQRRAEFEASDLEELDEITDKIYNEYKNKKV